MDKYGVETKCSVCGREMDTQIIKESEYGEEFTKTVHSCTCGYKWCQKDADTKSS